MKLGMSTHKAEHIVLSSSSSSNPRSPCSRCTGSLGMNAKQEDKERGGLGELRRQWTGRYIVQHDGLLTHAESGYGGRMNQHRFKPLLSNANNGGHSAQKYDNKNVAVKISYSWATAAQWLPTAQSKLHLRGLHGRNQMSEVHAELMPQGERIIHNTTFVIMLIHAITIKINKM